MQENIINLIKKSRGTVDYKISHYPDGQTDIELGEINLKWPVRIICRIRNAEELFMLRMVSSVLKDMHARIKNIDIMYLMAARTDRKFSWNRPCTLDIVINDIRFLGAEYVNVYEPHNYSAIFNLCSGSDGSVISPISYISNEETGSYPDLFFELKDYSLGTDYEINPETTYLVAPDEGARDRMKDDVRYHSYRILYCRKNRDPRTGRVQSVELCGNADNSNVGGKNLLVVDDLSDRGGTFLALVNVLRRYGAKTIGLCISHCIQEDGLKDLAKAYDFVATTDSYKDWNHIVEEDPESYPNVLVCKLKYRPYTKE